MIVEKAYLLLIYAHLKHYFDYEDLVIVVDSMTIPSYEELSLVVVRYQSGDLGFVCLIEGALMIMGLPFCRIRNLYRIQQSSFRIYFIIARFLFQLRYSVPQIPLSLGINQIILLFNSGQRKQNFIDSEHSIQIFANGNIIINFMTTSISKNLSHRHLIKQRTKELFYYPQCYPRSSKNTNSRVADPTTTVAYHQNQTSINLDRSIDTSLSKRLRSSVSRSKNSLMIGSEQKLKYSFRSGRKSQLSKFKSTELLPKNNKQPLTATPCHSQKKLQNQYSTPNKPKMKTIQNIQKNETPKKQVLHPNLPHSQNFIPRSQTDLKQTLKKTTTTKLKLKVKDPFEKRVKLDLQFQDQSAINRNCNYVFVQGTGEGCCDVSMVSSVQKEDIRDLLRELN